MQPRRSVRNHPAHAPTLELVALPSTELAPVVHRRASCTLTPGREAGSMAQPARPLPREPHRSHTRQSDTASCPGAYNSLPGPRASLPQTWAEYGPRRSPPSRTRAPPLVLASAIKQRPLPGRRTGATRSRSRQTLFWLAPRPTQRAIGATSRHHPRVCSRARLWCIPPCLPRREAAEGNENPKLSRCPRLAERGCYESATPHI